MQRNWEKWERYRDGKLEKMRVHKSNIERRMQNEKVEDWSYWSQRRDSLKRYPKHESLNPTWYTDNIYSNQSLDLDDTGGAMAPDAPAAALARLRRRHIHRYDERDGASAAAAAAADDGPTATAMQYREHTDNSDQFDDDDIFSINPRAKHATGNLLMHSGDPMSSSVHRDYKYPKSRSCCFGGGYDPQPPAVSLMPKSSSFGSTARAATMHQPHQYGMRAQPARFDCCQRIGAGGGQAAALREDDVVVERLTYRRSVAASAAADDFERRQLENDLCYARQRDEASRHSMYMLDETYPPRRRPKVDIERMRNNTDYIRNEWLNKGGQQQRQRPDDSNGNGFHQEADYFEYAGPEQYHDQQHEHQQRPSFHPLLSPGQRRQQQQQQQLHLQQQQQQQQRQRRRQRRHQQHQHLLHQQQQQQLQRQSSSYDSDVDQFGAGAGLFSDDIDAELEDDFEIEAAGVDHDYFAYMRRPIAVQPPPAGRTLPVVAQSKSALEVQAPSRYDDTSSDSTDVDLDDFNFDFEKYWENLDKTNSSYDIDIQNNNTYNNLGRAPGAGRKLKDVNVSRYNNGRQRDHPRTGAPSDEPYTPEAGALFLGKHSHLLESLLAPSLDSSDNQDYQEHLAMYNDPNRPKNNATNAPGEVATSNNNNNMDNGIGYMSDIEFMVPPTHATRPSATSPFHRPPFGHKIHPEADYLGGHAPRLPSYPPPPPPLPHPILKHPTPVFVTSPLRRAATAPAAGGHTHNPFSLINNIFSIYKPKKYSPLNVSAAAAAVGNRTVPPAGGKIHQLQQQLLQHQREQQQQQQHPPLMHRGGAAKKMNVASTIRPLGGPANDFITSLKRPLLVTPSQPCVEQPHFKIIPEKTGLKISPLYRFDYDSGERKYMLRSTARPLMMFPN